jgi:hypothetical protein
MFPAADHSDSQRFALDPSPLPQPPTRNGGDFNSSEDEEVVGVTAEGELLFRPKQLDATGQIKPGRSGISPASVGGIPRQSASHARENRLRPTPRAVAVTRPLLSVRSAASVFPQNSVPGEDQEFSARLKMLALRCRDKENDIYQAFAQEQFRAFHALFNDHRRGTMEIAMEKFPLKTLR